MPRTFSPGHRPDSPLYPDETVYTTPTKVSEYLQLPLPDPVALAGDSVIASNDIKFPITGADYRRWGYEVGDAIVVYDNANAIGNTYTLTSIASVGASGQVYLIATKAASESFTTANKGYVQHQSAFTNSNERGIKLSHVKNLIRQRQDYIDKVCRHAWRPRLVGEEYLNFTTFKPFRRRYYTDYVGAVFLKRGAIQRILKLGAWQGDYYREMAGARESFRVDDHTALAGESILLCPGANGVATLTEGSDAQTKWRADFDHKSTAENISALVNKDPAFSKAALPIGNLTVESGSSSSDILNVHEEFLCLANSDTGDGVAEISSMRSTEGGANATIAVTHDTALIFNSTLSQIVSSTISTVTGSPSLLTLVNGGTGYSTANGVATTGGSGSNLTVNIVEGGGDGVIDSVAIGTAGTGYQIGDTITITTNGANATCTVASVTNATTFTLADGTTFAPGHSLAYITSGTTNRIALCSRNTNTFTIVANQLNDFDDYLTIGDKVKQIRFKCDIADEERQKSWWSIEENGMILFNNEYPFFENHSLRCAYIYGERYIEGSIHEACTKLVVMDILMSDDYSVMFPEGSSNIDLNTKHQKLEAEVAKLLVPFQETIIVAGMGG